jgi:hypothetical protein
VQKKYFWIFFALVALYIILAFSLPTDPEILKKYDISQNNARWLNLTIIAPITLVYFTALYGFLRFKAYADNVKKTKEGKPLQLLATGLMVLAFGLPIASILGSIISYFQFSHPDLLALSTITRNYVALLFPFVAFTYIARGAEQLVATLKDKKVITNPVLALIGPIVLSSLFTWLITSRPQSSITEPVYYMSNLLVILTLAIPYVYIWCVAIKAARNLYFYKDCVRGRIYKRALDNVTKGIFVITILSILVQLITTLSEKINRLDLTPLLLLLYVLVALYALGYGLLARGAKKLKQIEEV